MRSLDSKYTRNALGRGPGNLQCSPDPPAGEEGGFVANGKGGERKERKRREGTETVGEGKERVEREREKSPPK